MRTTVSGRPVIRGKEAMDRRLCGYEGEKKSSHGSKGDEIKEQASCSELCGHKSANEGGG